MEGGGGWDGTKATQGVGEQAEMVLDGVDVSLLSFAEGGMERGVDENRDVGDGRLEALA